MHEGVGSRAELLFGCLRAYLVDEHPEVFHPFQDELGPELEREATGTTVGAGEGTS